MSRIFSAVKGKPASSEDGSPNDSKTLRNLRSLQSVFLTLKGSNEYGKRVIGIVKSLFGISTLGNDTLSETKLFHQNKDYRGLVLSEEGLLFEGERRFALKRKVKRGGKIQVTWL